MTVNDGSGVPMTRYRGLEATESEIRRAMVDPGARIVEWETAGLTYVLSERNLVIVRAGALGGDVRNIDGGWRYLRVEDFWSEAREILSVAGSFRRGQGKRKGKRQ